MKLILMRGISGSGKSTWVKNHNLENYTISPDKIKLVYSGLERVNSFETISQKDSTEVWDLVYKILDNRFRRRNKLTVIDACFLTEYAFKKVYNISKSFYDVDIDVIDFIPYTSLKQALERNKKRFNTITYVPPEVIRNMYYSAQDIPHYGHGKFTINHPDKYIIPFFDDI